MSNAGRNVRTGCPVDELSISDRSSTAASMETTKTKAVWSPEDSFLPRAKPPPPLKFTKRQRDRSSTDPPPPNPMLSRSRPSQQSLQSRSDRSIIDISVEKNDKFAVHHPLARSGSLLTMKTTSSSGSDVSDISLAPLQPVTGLTWQPPIDWDRLPEDEELQPAKVGNPQVSLRFPRPRLPTTLKSHHATVVGRPGKDVFDAQPAGVKLRIHCCENGAWHEKSMADVIPMLRGLK